MASGGADVGRLGAPVCRHGSRTQARLNRRRLPVLFFLNLFPSLIVAVAALGKYKGIGLVPFGLRTQRRLASDDVMMALFHQ